jgi:formylmethanofuran dehydrogenase subunit E
MLNGPSPIFPEELLPLKRFHGHLGPYVVMGYRMGKVARERYPGRIHAIVFCGSKRPCSCMADGVQFASCCTLGKSNIEIVKDGQPAAIFTDGNTAMEIAIQPPVVSRIDEQMTHENEEDLSLEIYQMDDEILLRVNM